MLTSYTNQIIKVFFSNQFQKSVLTPFDPQNVRLFLCSSIQVSKIYPTSAIRSGFYVQIFNAYVSEGHED